MQVPTTISIKIKKLYIKTMVYINEQTKYEVGKHEKYRMESL